MNAIHAHAAAVAPIPRLAPAVVGAAVAPIPRVAPGVAGPAAPVASVDDTGATPPVAARRGFAFWVVRYLPAEIVGTAAMVIGGLAATTLTDSAPLIALAALVGEIIGFYAVLAVTVYLEQRETHTHRRVALSRTLMLLVAEFGVAELLDTLLIRPAALIAGVWLLTDPMWGLLAGKVVADVIFYAIAAGAFTLTFRVGLRDRRRVHGTAATPERSGP